MNSMARASQDVWRVCRFDSELTCEAQHSSLSERPSLGNPWRVADAYDACSIRTRRVADNR